MTDYASNIVDLNNCSGHQLYYTCLSKSALAADINNSSGFWFKTNNWWSIWLVKIKIQRTGNFRWNYTTQIWESFTQTSGWTSEKYIIH